MNQNLCDIMSDNVDPAPDITAIDKVDDNTVNPIGKKPTKKTTAKAKTKTIKSNDTSDIEEWEAGYPIKFPSDPVAVIEAMNTTTAKKRAVFSYRGDTYVARGANKKNLSYFALRLIMDYANETDKTADQLMNMINSIISCYFSDMARDGWVQVCDMMNPYLNDTIRAWYFTGNDQIVWIDGRELIVVKGWGVLEIIALIWILGYSDMVTLSMI
jgi:hypothetical protein